MNKLPVSRRGVVEAECEVHEAECDADVEDDDDAEGGVRYVGHAPRGVGQQLEVAVGQLGEEFRRVVGVHPVERVQLVCVVNFTYHTQYGL